MRVNAGDAYVLFDDDDYNNNDGANPDGDNGEPFLEFTDTRYYISDTDGRYLDNTPRNILGSAYIMPEYAWASPFNQTNVTFNTNVNYTLSNNTAAATLINQNRGSAGIERDDFWVAYILLGYQGPLTDDLDGNSGTQFEDGHLGIMPQLSLPCDCVSSTTCPPSGSTCAVVPQGGQGAIIFQEVVRDTVYFYQNVFTPSKTVTVVRTAAAHELAHQFGLQGDDVGIVFKLMDYPDFNLPGVTGPSIEFHPEHINILRRRIKSPGQP